VRGWKFERFLSVVREACREKKRNPSTGARVNLGFTAFRDNICELPDLLKMASHLGIDRVTVTHFVPWQENQRGKSLVYHRNIANEMIEKASFLSKEFNLLVDLPKPFREDEAQTKADISKGEVWVRKPCYHPWRSFSINEKGEVMPCCATSVVMGNLEKSSFLEIWNGPKYRKLRKTVNSSQPLSFCGNCGLRGIEVGSSAPLSFCSDENILLAVIGPTNHVRTFTSILRRVKDSLYKVRWGRKLLPGLVEFHRQHGAFSSLEAYSDGFISLLNKGVTSLRKRKGLQS